MIGVAIGLLLLFLALSIPVGIAMGLLGLALSELYSPLPLTVMMGEVTWSTSNSFILVAVPFYILLGEIVLRSGIAERMYNALVQWFSWLPGGLMHSNVASCAMFAAISGSSVATAVTIGTVALGEVKKHDYNEPLFLGTLAAGGTLGILIPPSINMVVYGVMTETSIPQLYLAGFIPGIVLALLFMLTVLLACLWRPRWGGRPVVTNWEARIRTLPDLVPPLIIFLIVIGSIYAGLATATESAALGILGALALAAWNRRLTLQMLVQAFEGTMRTSATVMLILVGAYFLNVVINAIGLTAQVGQFVSSLNLSPTELLIAVIVFYLILGCFMETMSMMVATIPITTPIMVQAGYDPVWYGILIVILMETAMVTPPVGINLFVVQGVRGRGQLHDVIIGTSPFVVTLVLMIAIICVFPELVLWLPRIAK
jgi:tripartite ATP-independent transporter DctM subunit